MGLRNQIHKINFYNKLVGLMNQTPTQDESKSYDFQAGINSLSSLTFLKSKDRI
jgi:hypothetical protein